ncbi:carboxypeptidase-like regulatory domain-containing protein [Rufibacter glacialis]|uniref:Carboxypeptidase-like regulatory domain-containing protein n=1 Tax=Rufibacter glacialis TaxID=1259555 RepID=A0A5M8QG59_9BACT|nr:carboxypeptidase-like regulatory domain-containing protein [Rufibacter glacialis]KAA6433392.1 carboxypeptidase-like regulatory domain-containing protein [Rufibacter glacialis]GGK74621.1 membrane protein [Rufibacter glacialis]
MKQTVLLFIFQILAGWAFAQVKGVITDKATNKPVAFANIWVENENLGTTSSEKGEFAFTAPGLTGKTLIISCLGYEKTRVTIPAGTLKIGLAPSAVALKEVTVKKSAKRSKLVVNKLDGNTHYSFGSNGTPWIVAQYIPYQPSYAATPFLDAVSLVTLSNLKNASFKLHLLRVGKNGEPDQSLLSTPLLGLARKGINTTTLDVSQHDLQIPEQGLFIAFEWLILKQNRHEAEDPETGAKEGSARVSYEPSIRSYGPDHKSPNGWIYHQGKWISTNQREGDAVTSATPHFQLTLSN